MIRYFLISALLVTSLHGRSQENKNKFMINGGIGYSKWQQKTEYQPYRNSAASAPNFYCGIHLGYFISNTFAVGVFGSKHVFGQQVTYTPAPSPLSSLIKHNYSGHRSSLGLFARYYKLVVDNKFGFLFQAQLASERQRSDSKELYSDPLNGNFEFRDYSRSKGGYISLTPGLIYFINKKISLETDFAALSYTITNTQTHNTINKMQGGRVEFFPTLNLAFTYYFGFKNKQE